MDGTLVNTEPVGPKVFAELFETQGVQLSQDEKDLFLKVWQREGTTIKENDYLETLHNQYQIPIESASFISSFYEQYKAGIIKAPALPGVDAFLEKAFKSGRKLAIVTSSKREQARAVLEFHDWADYFSLIVSEEDITSFKPDPEPYLVASKKLDVSPGQCIVFEDAKSGAIAGTAAGMTVVGLRAGNDTEQDLSACTVIVETFKDIKLQDS